MSTDAQAEAAVVVASTPHARAMLRARYAAPEWAFLEEVAPATGGGTRYADAIAVNLWQSRGHAIHGFEIKVSRGDWLRELKQPEKAEPVFRYCDMWWIVAPRGVVKDGELPPTWGLLELRANGLVATKQAPKLDPQPVGRAFFASLMRRGFEQLDRMAESKIAEARAAMNQEISKEVDDRVRHRSRELAELKEQIAKFEAATGMSFSRYAPAPIGVAKVAQRLVELDGYADQGSLSRLTRLADELEKCASIARKAVSDSGLIPEPASKPGGGAK